MNRHAITWRDLQRRALRSVLFDVACAVLPLAVVVVLYLVAGRV